MTAKEFVERVEHWRLRLCPDWTVALSDKPPSDRDPEDDDWVACTRSKPIIREVTIWWKPDELLENPDEFIDRIIVHELVHPLLDIVLNHDEQLDPFVPHHAMCAYRERRREDMEWFVDRLANVVVFGDLHRETRAVERPLP